MSEFRNSNKYTINIGGIICLFATVFFIYYLLLKDFKPFSLASMINYATHLHVLAVGLIPIYLSFLIFGTALISIYFGSYIQKIILHFWQG